MINRERTQGTQEVKVKKSEGVNFSENLLAQLCESTFLKLWSYPNPFKDDGKEMCDVIAVFNNEVFLFFDRKSEVLEGAEVDENYLVKWNRWRRKVIEKQLKTVYGAERYLRSKKKGVFRPTAPAGVTHSFARGEHCCS